MVWKLARLYVHAGGDMNYIYYLNSIAIENVATQIQNIDIMWSDNKTS